MKETFAIEEVRGSAYLFATRSKSVDEPAPEPEPERKMPRKVGGVFVHGAECGCWLCADEDVVA